MRRIALLMLSCAAAAGESPPAWVAANFVGDPPARLLRSRDGMLRWVGLWGTRRLQHAGAVLSVAVSPDGSWIASGSEDGTVRLWEAKTGREIRGFDLGDAAYEVAASSDGTRLQTRIGDEVRVLDARSGTTLQSWKVPEDEALALSADGKWVARWGSGGLRVCDASQGACGWTTTQPTECAVFTPDGSRLVTCGGDTLVRVWDVGTGAVSFTLGTSDASTPGTDRPHPCHVFVDRAATEISAVWTTGEIARWDLRTRKAVAPLHGHDDPCDVLYSPDGRTIASVGQWETTFWDRGTGKCLRKWDQWAALAFAPDGSWLVAGTEDGALQIRDAASDKERLVADRFPAGVSDLAVSEDGTWGACALGVEVRVLDAATGALRRRLTRDGQRTNAIALTTDGRVVSDWGREPESSEPLAWEGRAVVWDPLTGRDLHALDGALGFGSRIVVSPGGEWIVAATAQTIYVWDQRSGQLARTLHGSYADLESLAISRDGKRVAAAGVVVGDEYSRLCLWDVSTEAPVVAVRCAYKIGALCFSPDGSLLAGAADSVRLWATKDGAEAGLLRGNTGRLTALAWSEHGRWIFSAEKDVLAPAQDTFVRVWDVATGKEADVIPVDGGPNALAFSHGRLYVGCANRTVCVYEWTPSR